jgi:hypothetical protein
VRSGHLHGQQRLEVILGVDPVDDPHERVQRIDVVANTKAGTRLANHRDEMVIGGMHECPQPGPGEVTVALQPHRILKGLKTHRLIEPRRAVVALDQRFLLKGARRKNRRQICLCDSGLLAFTGPARRV